MTLGSRAALVAAVSLLIAHQAGAACRSAKCLEGPAVDTVRTTIAAACDCAGTSSRGAYLRCARDIVKAALADGTLRKSCKSTVLRCEAQSTCGRQKLAICCSAKKGRTKARFSRSGGQCGGELCESPMALADACTPEGTCAAPTGGIRSFRSVQRIFKTSCALSSCHSTFYRQGGLVLETEDLSHASLVDRLSEHPEAKAAGLLRVKTGDPKASFLINKLRGQGPGDPMPQSGALLPDPVIKMIEDWIARGARTTTEECTGPSGQNLCDDDRPTGNYTWKPLEALEAPAPGTGIQLYTPPRDVTPGEEWETCYAFRPDWTQLAAAIGTTGGELPIIRAQTYRMHEGSHHLLLYAYAGAYPEQWAQGYFPCIAANCINPADCPEDADTALLLPIGGTQVAGTRYEVNYPEGVGIPALGPNMVLIANLHYTNPFQPPQQIYGESWLNLYFYRPGEFKALLDGIFAINFSDLLVEPYQTRTISRVWQPRGILGGGAADAAIFQLFGHMHKRATEFQIDLVRGGYCSNSLSRPVPLACGRDSDCPAGQTCVRAPGAEDTTIYYTTAWDQAPVVDFQPPYLLINRQDGLRWTCTHVNGVQGDPTRPPKRCHEGCQACGWDAASRTCIFRRGVPAGAPSRIFAEGDPMPLVFGQLADDDMCNMFGYFINQASLANLP